MACGTPQDSRWGVTYFHRRKYPRINVTLPVEYRIIAEPASPKVPAAAVRPSVRQRQTRAKSLGGGGLLIETSERLVRGTRLSLTLYLPDPAVTSTEVLEITCVVRVVWADILSDLHPDEYKCGVEFLEIDPQNREKIITFIRAHEINAVAS
jgi:c-di-GMP-binding flagellar brake protein YcgR